MKKVLLFFALFMLAHTVGATITITKDAETGIVIIEQTSAKEIGYALQNNTLSAEERNMVTSANGFVLSGPFANDPDLMQLAQKNNSITVLDMGDCNISPNNLMIPSTWKDTLEEFVIPTHNSFNKLPENFLYGFQKIKTIEIPANVKTIESGALGNMTIHEITIPATLDIIKSQAFKETIILKDVYVESSHTVCEMNAFDFNTLVGQTDISSFYEHAAKLHYPNTPEDYEYFVGSWKEGRTISQDNLNGFKDGLYEWNGFYVEKVGPWNGWQQFALSDNAEPFTMVNNIVRTYSDSYEHDNLPTGGQYEIRVYRVTGYSTRTNTTIMQRIRNFWRQNTIPANTGVVLWVVTNGSSYLHYFAKTNNGITSYPWKWGGNNNSNGNNLLEKSIEPTEVHPVWPWPKTTVEYRNFGLSKSGNKYIWVRLTSSTMRANRAYLKLTASLFPNNNEGSEEGPGDNTINNAKAFGMFGSTTTNLNEDEEAIKNDVPIGSPGIEIIDDNPFDESYQNIERVLYADPNDVVIPYNGGIATNIGNVINKQDDNYYTLQGIRVKNPSKGVYIKNGKKVIVK